MTDFFKPMLAGEAVLETLRFPVLASAKLDGVRAIIRDNMVYSRSNKLIPNAYVQSQIMKLNWLDGELIVGEPTSKTVYRDTVSHVMSHDKTGYDLRFYAFDHVQGPNKPFMERFKLIPKQHRLDQHLVTDLNSLLALEEFMLEQGYEGLILRDPNAQYKYGRSTTREGALLKLKRFVDAEAMVIGFEERMHNGNEATTNELGRTKRSSHAAGKTGRGDLGAIVVRFGEVEFSIGTGFTDDERNTIWLNRDKYLGAFAKFKYFPVGVKDAPRHPVFLGWRDAIDT